MSNRDQPQILLPLLTLVLCYNTPEEVFGMADEFTETLVDSQTVFQGQLLTVQVDQVRLTDGHVGRREVVIHRGAVAMVPLLDMEHVLLVRQWRHAVGRALLEIPAGGLAQDEDPASCAERELMEECGYRPRRLSLLSSLMLAPGYSSEILHLYLAEELIPERLPHDLDERIEVVMYHWNEIDVLMRKGELVDAKTICGLLLARSACNA